MLRQLEKVQGNLAEPLKWDRRELQHTCIGMLKAAVENEEDSRRYVATAHELLLKNTLDATEESKTEENSEEDSANKEEGEEDNERRTKSREDQYHGPVMLEEVRWELRPMVKGKGVLR
ncbi:hypothetical protein AMTR_s00005p00183860 [Amborella trichopoda]|uniref:Uncharacterized protein n=1 Tax=Amborella trichopoda TaxID=13333 RepID=W1PFR4_AMBTC|nr:hypothetical protein AMTR_s00005p00183860 [Amborella trichopoda]